MAVKRIWFPNAPDSASSEGDRYQLGVGLDPTSGVPPTETLYMFINMGNRIAITKKTVE